MKKITWNVDVGQCCGTFEIEDAATDEEIEERALEEAMNFVDWAWEVNDE